MTTLVEQRFGAAKGASDVVGLTIGTGIGGGLVLGRPGLPRATGAAGAELGPHGRRRGRAARARATARTSGCLEAVASGTAIGREGTMAAEEEPDSELGDGAPRATSRSPASS